VACTIRFSVSQLERGQGATPSRLRILKVAQQLARLLEEDVVVVDLAGRHESGAKAQLPF
jgi:hypothetical protein